MSERYSRLYALPENLYLNGSPVLIAAGALLKDNKVDKVLAQLKLCNLYHSPLTACKVHIRAFEPGGAELEGVEAHSYLDIRVNKGKNFGSQEAVYLPDNTTRRISVCVVQAVFEDGTVWQHPATEWSQPGFKMQRISELLEDIELQNQYSKEVGGRCTYVPEVLGSLSLCTCGALNLTDEGSCHVCGRKMKDLLSALDVEELTRKRDARIAKEEAERIERERIAEAERQERERREEAERIGREWVAEEQRIAAEQRKKQIIKIAVLIGAIVAVAIAVVLVITQVIVPANKYKAAEELLAARDYDGAISTFNELGNYKDSSERAAHVPYVRAEDFLADCEYDSALEAFRALGDYGDAAERVKETTYLKAEHLLSDKYYDSALELFKSLDNYSNAAEYVNEILQIKYNQAESLLNAGDYIEAKEAFSELGNYKDSISKIEECENAILESKYNAALVLMNEKKYEDAITVFEEIDNYKDSKDQITLCMTTLAENFVSAGDAANAIKWYEELGDKESANKVRYDYVQNNKDSSNLTTYQYLKTLKANNYLDSVNIYKNLYRITGKLFFNEDSYDTSTSKTSINSYDSAGFHDGYCHFILQGGPPEKEVKIKIVYETRYGYNNVPSTPYRVWSEFEDAVEVEKHYHISLSIIANIYYHRVSIYDIETGEQIVQGVLVSKHYG